MNRILLVSLILTIINATKIDISNHLKCLVCEASIEELNRAVFLLDPSKNVDVGGYRLDADGNYKQKSVPEAKSELKLSELIENVCEKMDDYVRATYKSNGTLSLLRLMDEHGGMNSAMSDFDLIQDDDLNKSLKYNCQAIMEEYEENIIKLYQQGVKDVKNEICLKTAELCRQFQPKNDEL